MQVLIAVIEKTGTEYIARCPNLPGVSITAKTFEEAQNAILDAIDGELDKMRQALGKRSITVGRGKLGEAVDCLYDYRDSTVSRSNDKCVAAAQKDGFCWNHWRSVYGHYWSNKVNPAVCWLCGESDRAVLLDWESPCPFKAENKNWRDVIEQMREVKQAALVKENRKKRMEKNLLKAKKHPKHAQLPTK